MKKLQIIIIIVVYSIIFDISEAPMKEFGYKIGYYIQTGDWIEVKYIDFFLIK